MLSKLHRFKQTVNKAIISKADILIKNDAVKLQNALLKFTARNFYSFILKINVVPIYFFHNFLIKQTITNGSSKYLKQLKYFNNKIPPEQITIRTITSNRFLCRFVINLWYKRVTILRPVQFSGFTSV